MVGGGRGREYAVDRVAPGAVKAVATPSGDRGPAGAALIYFHGGAFVHGIRRQHWALVADLADATGAPVYVPHYGRAPEHTSDEALDLVDALVEHLSGASEPAQEPSPAAAVRIHLAGDSAGGTLALLAAQHLRGRHQVTGLTLISPALDLTQSNPAIADVEPLDPWLSRAGTRPLLEAWAGDRDLDDPLVSPVLGDLSGLPPIHVFSGTHDICWPDVAVLRRRAAEAGTDVTVHAAEGSPHVHVLLPTPEGRRDRATLLATAGASVHRR
jgi:acetyl esterase/lipase